MEVVSSNTLLPGDPRLIDHIVCELKSQGIFDQFRKECIADVDTKPAYQNLRQRVEGSVIGFLKSQVWRPDMNKNYLREMLRKNIYESGFLETGVERIVDQVVNPKINTVFLPQVEDVVYKFLGLEKPHRIVKNGPLTINTMDLLPTDLDPISPDSEVLDKSMNKSNETDKLDDSKADDFESPPFEPINEQSMFSQQDDSSNDSHLSGISGLTSHDSNLSTTSPNKTYYNIPEMSNQDSQLSKVSSTSRLSIVTMEDKLFSEKMDISDDTQTSTKPGDGSNSKSSLSVNNSNSENGIVSNFNIKDQTDVIQSTRKITEDFRLDDIKMEIKKEILDKDMTEVEMDVSDNSSQDKPIENLLTTKAQPELTIKQEDIKQECVKVEEIKPEVSKPNDKKSTEKSRSDSDRHKSRHSDYKDKKDAKKPDDKDKKERDRKPSSSSSSKDKYRDKSKDSKSKDKEKESKSKEETNKSEKDSSKSKSSSSSSSKYSSRDKEKSNSKSLDRKDSSSRDKDRSESRSKSRSDKSKSDDSKTKSDDSKSKSDDSKSKSDDSKSKSEDSKPKSDESKSDKNKSTDLKLDKPKSDDTKSKQTEPKSEKSKSDDSKSDHSSKSRSDDKSQSKKASDSKHRSKSESSKDKKSSSSSYKDRKDTKKSSRRDKDDHFSSKDKKTETRRSTDRDSNDGNSGVGTTNSSKDSSSSSNKTKSEKSFSGSNSGDSGQSDKQEDVETAEHKNAETDDNFSVTESVSNTSEFQISPLNVIQDSENHVKLKKPKIASNIFEARKLMKIRKKLEKLERKRQIEYDLTHPENEKTDLQVDSDRNRYQKEESKKHQLAEDTTLDKEQEEIQSEDETSVPKVISDEAVNNLEEKLEKDEHQDNNAVSVISKESWDAIEAKINQSSLLNINYDSYIDENADSCSSNKSVEEPNENTERKSSDEEDCLYFNPEISPTTERYLKSIDALQKQGTNLMALGDGFNSVDDTNSMAPPNSAKGGRRSRKPNLKYCSTEYESEVTFTAQKVPTFETTLSKADLAKNKKGQKRRFDGEIEEMDSDNNNKKMHTSLEVVELYDGETEENDEPSPCASNTSSGSLDSIAKTKSVVRQKKVKKTEVGVANDSFTMPLSPESDVSTHSVEVNHVKRKYNDERDQLVQQLTQPIARHTREKNSDEKPAKLRR